MWQHTVITFPGHVDSLSDMLASVWPVVSSPMMGG
jgi:hypothetical protein